MMHEAGWVAIGPVLAVTVVASAQRRRFQHERSRVVDGDLGLGSGLVDGGGAIGAAIGESLIGAAAMDALARQPDEAGSITRTLFVSLAMVESTAIFCLVIA